MENVINFTQTSFLKATFYNDKNVSYDTHSITKNSICDDITRIGLPLVALLGLTYLKFSCCD